MNEHLFVFRPGGPNLPPVFKDWPLLISAMSSVEGVRCWSLTTRSRSQRPARSLQEIGQ